VSEKDALLFYKKYKNTNVTYILYKYKYN